MTTDPFTAVLGDRRGRAEPPYEPRHRDPVTSLAADITSLTAFGQRIRVGVTGTLDHFDDLGRVRRRLSGTVVRTRKRGVPSFELETADGKRAVVRYPTRVADCKLDGPTLECAPRGWRFTIEVDAVAPTRVRVPRQARADLTAQLSAHWPLPEGDLPRWGCWREPTVPGPLFCRTTDRVKGHWWSFVCVPAGRGSRSTPMTYKLDHKSMRPHEHKRNADMRAKHLFGDWRTNGGKPWQ